MSWKTKLLRRFPLARLPLLLSLAMLTFSLSCTKLQTRNRFDENQFPKRILWAWERPEDLAFLDPHKFAVAFLAQTLVLKNDDVEYKPRRQPLKVKPETRLIAVTRIESEKTTGTPTALSPAQRQKLIALILKTTQANNVAAIQIDFDAVRSEREFYRQLLQDLRQKLPDNVPLSMTALASFCVGDRWLDDLPVDEAVPMIFRMGADTKTIRTYLTMGNDFREPLCRRSYGIALDEPIETNLPRSRRKYVFNARSWTPTDVLTLQDEVQ